MAKGQTRRRRIPQRTCVACRKTVGKRDLVRIVRTPEGSVCVDRTGKQSGRGAYLCNSRRCWALALEQGRIGKALKARIDGEARSRLAEFARQLPSNGGRDGEEELVGESD